MHYIERYDTITKLFIKMIKRNKDKSYKDTGQQKATSARGRIDKFNKKYGVNN